MFFPIIIGIFNYGKFDNAYKLLFYSTGLMIINQIIFSLFKFSPLWNNIFNYVSILSCLSLNTSTIVLWSDIQKKGKFISAFITISIIIIFFEVYSLGLEEYRSSIALSISSIISMVITVYVLVNLVKQKLLYKIFFSRKLFLIPFIIIKAYGNSIDLFMFFLYVPETAKLFMNLYDVYLYLAAIYYIFIGFSFLSAPKKEVFI